MTNLFPSSHPFGAASRSGDVGPRKHRLPTATLLLCSAALAVSTGCHHSAKTTSSGAGGSTSSTGSTGTGGQRPAPITVKLTPMRPPLKGFNECNVTITDNVPYEGATHEPVCTPITYASNPPSSGNHWPIWAMFKEYTSPIPREMYVHDMEHGAVVMLYNCGATLCPDIITAFETARTAFGIDPVCAQTSATGPQARIVIAPDTRIPTPIALAAWQSTYVATCIDPPSLLDFMQKHYDHGSEHFCADGFDPADPANGVTACPNVP